MPTSWSPPPGSPSTIRAPPFRSARAARSAIARPARSARFPTSAGASRSTRTPAAACHTRRLISLLDRRPVEERQLAERAADAQQQRTEQSVPAGVEELRPEDLIIQAVPPRAQSRDADRRSRQDQVVLPAFLDDEEAVVAVHGPGRDQHQRDETGGRDGSEQAGSQAQARADLRRRGNDGLKRAVLHADAFEPARGARYPAATEEFVEAVRGQRQTQH